MKAPSPTQRPTVAQSLAAEHRKMRLTATAGLTLEFIGGTHYAPVTVPAGRDNDAPLRFASSSVAYAILREAEGATAALMAKLGMQA